MTNITIRLDIVDQEEDGFVALAQRWPKINFEVVDPHGPAGGHPVVAVSGNHTDIVAWMAAEYDN